MHIARALIVAISGLTFIFLPGLVVAAVTRRDLRAVPGILLWGIGVMIVTLFPALFLTSLLRFVIIGDRLPTPGMPYVIAFLGTMLAALFLEWGTYLLLRWRKIERAALTDSGLMAGLGIGLVTQVFQGMALVSAGFRMLLGDTSASDLAAIAAQSWPSLLTSLAALNVYRLALVALSAVMGSLVARALVFQRTRWVWLAVAIAGVSAWGYNAIGLALGSDSLAGGLAVIGYEGLLAALTLVWLKRGRSLAPPV